MTNERQMPGEKQRALEEFTTYAKEQADGSIIVCLAPDNYETIRQALTPQPQIDVEDDGFLPCGKCKGSHFQIAKEGGWECTDCALSIEKLKQDVSENLVVWEPKDPGYSRISSTGIIADKIIDYLASRNLLRTQAYTEWQPINTAPKDAKKILVFVPAEGIYGQEFHIAEWDKTLWRGSTGEGCESWITGNPTHWMPLPPHPKDDE